MENKGKYVKVFLDVFEVSENEVADLRYQQIKAWDSVGHMSLIAALEDAFDIMMDAEDIIAFDSFQTGMRILSEKYEIVFD